MPNGSFRTISVLCSQKPHNAQGFGCWDEILGFKVRVEGGSCHKFGVSGALGIRMDDGIWVGGGA